MPSEIQRHFYIHTPFFPHFQILPVSPQKCQNFKFDKFLPRALSLIQNEPKEPKRSQINPHLDYKTAVYILLEDAAYRCFDLARTDLAHLSPNRATHLKSPKKKLDVDIFNIKPPVKTGCYVSPPHCWPKLCIVSLPGDTQLTISGVNSTLEGN